MGRPSFYAEGIRFECQGSGKCCTSRGTYGYVYLTLEDQKRFAKYFKLTPAKFLKQYCNERDGHVSLKNPEQMPKDLNLDPDDCIFLKEKRCNVYEARPQQCRTWPFWPENMNAKTWKTEVADYCPGVGKGPLKTAAEIQAIVDSHKEV